MSRDSDKDGIDWNIDLYDLNLEQTVALLPNADRSPDDRTDTRLSALRSDKNRISGSNDDPDHPDPIDGYDTIRRTGSSATCSPRVNVFAASAMAAVGGVLFGYDTGVISGAILQLNEEFQFSCRQAEIVISALMMGATVASLCGGFLVDRYGRRFTIIANDIVFLIGTIILTAADSYNTLIIGRLVVGFAVSLSATAECVYITEISPPDRRGLLVSLNELGITFGFLVAYLNNFIFISVQSGWRYMFAFGAMLAGFQGIGMFFLPKSPRYLVIRGQEKEAKQVLRSLMEPEEAENEFERIRTSVAETKNSKMADFCVGGRSSIWPAMFISITLVFLQQVSGQPSVLLYAPMIFRDVGLDSNSASVLATVGIGIVKFLVTVVFLVIVDRIGRRWLLMLGAALMMLSLILLGILIALFFPTSTIASTCAGIEPPILPHPAAPHLNSSLSAPPSLDGHVTTAVSGRPATSGLMTSSDFRSSDCVTWVALVAVFVYVGGYSIGFGPGTWLVMSEIFPSSVKGRAIAMATTINWAMQMATSLTLLDAIVAVGTWRLFVGYSVVCAFSVVFVYLFVPETKGKSLEQLSSELVDSSANALRSKCRFRR